mmetsp:Transcript_49127/g.116997  ORF Transcript_49127/g.116997 Transcript_49127/m.116997 type:complete len:1543 (-) Transcript_49127:199-4827(-)
MHNSSSSSSEIQPESRALDGMAAPPGCLPSSVPDEAVPVSEQSTAGDSLSERTQRTDSGKLRQGARANESLDVRTDSSAPVPEIDRGRSPGTAVETSISVVGPRSADDESEYEIVADAQNRPGTTGSIEQTVSASMQSVENALTQLQAARTVLRRHSSRSSHSSVGSEANGKNVHWASQGSRPGSLHKADSHTTNLTRHGSLEKIGSVDTSERRRRVSCRSEPGEMERLSREPDSSAAPDDGGMDRKTSNGERGSSFWTNMSAWGDRVKRKSINVGDLRNSANASTQDATGKKKEGDIFALSPQLPSFMAHNYKPPNGRRRSVNPSPAPRRPSQTNVKCQVTVVASPSPGNSQAIGSMSGQLEPLQPGEVSTSTLDKKGGPLDAGESSPGGLSVQTSRQRRRSVSLMSSLGSHQSDAGSMEQRNSRTAALRAGTLPFTTAPKRSSSALDMSPTSSLISAYSERGAIGIRCCCRFLQVCERIATSPWFETIFAFIIMFNTIIMAIQTQYDGMELGFELRYPGFERVATDVWPGAPDVFQVFEMIFGCLFTVELVIKILGLRVNFALSVWNWLDFAIVAAWLVDQVLVLTQAGNGGADFVTLARLARLVRVLRLLRLVRAIHKFDDLYLLTTSIKASLSALWWSTVLLLVVHAMFALVLNNILVEEFVLDESQALDKRQKIFLYYGTFSRAMLTMFEFALANWPPPSRALTEDVHEFWVIFILGYQCFVGFAVVKVLTGVFLHATFNVASSDDIIMLSQKQRAIRTHVAKMGILFEAADANSDGIIDKFEFEKLVHDQVVMKWLSSMECDVSHAHGHTDTLFHLIGGGEQHITVEELAKGISKLKGPARMIDFTLFLRDITHIRANIQEMIKTVDPPAKPPAPVDPFNSESFLERVEERKEEFLSQSLPRESVGRSVGHEPTDGLSTEPLPPCKVEDPPPPPTTSNAVERIVSADIITEGQDDRNASVTQNRMQGASTHTIGTTGGFHSQNGYVNGDRGSKCSQESTGSFAKDAVTVPMDDSQAVTNSAPSRKGSRANSHAGSHNGGRLSRHASGHRGSGLSRTKSAGNLSLADMRKVITDTFAVGHALFQPAHARIQRREGDKWYSRRSLEIFVRSLTFEATFSTLIFMNTAVMALERQYKGIHAGFEIGFLKESAHWPGVEDFFLATEWIFGICFTIELVLKFIATGKRFFTDAWNALDAIIVLAWVLSVFEQIPQLPLDPFLIRVIRLAKLLRILRLTKTIHGFDSLHLMTTSIHGSLSALAWSTALLFVVQMMISLIISQTLDNINYWSDGGCKEELMVGELLNCTGYTDSEPPPFNNECCKRHSVFRYFGTFSKSVLTMFEITLANWIPVTRTVTEYVSEWYVVVALSHKFFIGFAVVTVVTGVFLQETFKVAMTDDTIMMRQRERQIRSHTKKMNLLFEAADEDGNGLLDKEEFMQIVGEPSVQLWLSAMGLDSSDAENLFTLLAEDKGSLTAEELVKGTSRLKGAARSLDLAILMEEHKFFKDEVEGLRKRTNEQASGTTEEIARLRRLLDENGISY